MVVFANLRSIAKNREKMRKASLAEGKKTAMERAESMRSMGLSRMGSVIQHDCPQDFEAGPETGYPVRIPHRKAEVMSSLKQEKVDDANMRILSCVQKDQESTWYFLCPPEERLSLFFLRSIFTALRKQLTNDKLLQDVDQHRDADDNIPVGAFQRAFERLFFVLGDEKPFDAVDYDANNNGCVGWGEFSYLYKHRYIGIRWSICERIYRTLDDPESSIFAQLVSIFVLLVITVSSLTFIFSTVPDMKNEKKTFSIIEDVCLIIFTLEYCLRLCTVWQVRLEVLDKKQLMALACGHEQIHLASPLWRLIYFLIAPANVIDLAAILPGIIGWFVELEGGGFVVLRLIRLTRIFRAFRNPKLQEPVIVIAQTLVDSTKAMYVLAFNLGLGIIIFGSLMYLAEEGNEDGNVEWKSIPHAMWVGTVTATTVGYGDYYPETSLGYAVVTFCMLFSLVILALPIGVIGGNFDAVWQRFHKVQMETNKEMEQDRKFLVSAMQTVNPREMSRLLLIELWNERLPNLQLEKRIEGVHFRPHPGEFLGQVTLELDLPHDQPYYSGPIPMKLKPNYDIVKRDVTGTITIEYDWTPEGFMSDKPPTERADSPPTQMAEISSDKTPEPDLVGKFQVTILSAERLLNVCFLGLPGITINPYAIVFCYPHSPPAKNVKYYPVYPSAWRSPTCKNSVHPVWETKDKRKSAVIAWNFSWSAIATPRGAGSHATMRCPFPDTLERTIAKLHPAVQLEIFNALRAFGQELQFIQKDVAMLCDRYGVTDSSRRFEMACGYSPEPRTTDEVPATAPPGSSTFAPSQGDTASSAAPSPEPFETSPSALLEGLMHPPGAMPVASGPGAMPGASG